MARMLTDSQKSALETLTLCKVSSASWCDRHAFEALVKKGLAIKHSNGRQATYTLADRPKGFNDSKFDLAWERDN
jgi:predicted transcriptional regulator